MMSKKDITAWSVEEFIDHLRRVGEFAYHDKHPFHILMNDGKLSRK
jgi:pyrroloquinoline quinone (PQQ) biosynthesis protein C